MHRWASLKKGTMADRQLLVKCYDDKMVKSPFSWVIFPLTQPQVVNQKKKKKDHEQDALWQKKTTATLGTKIIIKRSLLWILIMPFVTLNFSVTIFKLYKSNLFLFTLLVKLIVVNKGRCVTLKYFNILIKFHKKHRCFIGPG